MVLKKFGRKLEKIVDNELTMKIGKYFGYSIEAGGFGGIIYGICIGDNWTIACSGFGAYFGTLIHRVFNYNLNSYKENRK